MWLCLQLPSSPEIQNRSAMHAHTRTHNHLWLRCLLHTLAHIHTLAVTPHSCKRLHQQRHECVITMNTQTIKHVLFGLLSWSSRDEAPMASIPPAHPCNHMAESVPPKEEVLEWPSRRYRQWQSPCGRFYFQDVDSGQTTWMPPGPYDVLLTSEAEARGSGSAASTAHDAAVGGIGAGLRGPDARLGGPADHTVELRLRISSLQLQAGGINQDGVCSKHLANQSNFVDARRGSQVQNLHDSVRSVFPL